MKFKKQFEFLGKTIGTPDTPPLLVAEVGFNHNGDVVLAEEMICVAKDCGADAVKLQTFIGTELYAKTFHAEDPDDPGAEIPFYEYWERYQLSRDDYARLFAFAKEIGIPLFSTPFDEGSLAMLLELGMGAIKIASGDLTHHALLKAAGAAGVPVVLSSGMATEEEVGQALDVLSGAGADRVALLHCVSNYPAKPEEMNLRVLQHLHDRFQVPVGLSDHTMEADSSILAATLGAAMIGFEALRDGLNGDATAYLRPMARLAEGELLAPHVTAMMDVSDGLLLDAFRMAEASDVSLAIDSTAPPIAAPHERRMDALRWGDDYELLFTLPEGSPSPVPATQIGAVEPRGFVPLFLDGEPVANGDGLGYSH